MQKTSHKERVSDVLINSKNYFLSTFFMRGNEYLYLYSFCGMGNDGSAIFVDLKDFNEDDFSLTPAEISKRKEDRKNRYSEKSILIKSILINPQVANLSDEQINNLGDLTEMQNLHESLAGNNQFKNSLSAYNIDDDDVKNLSTEDMIYESFLLPQIKH